MPPAAIKAAFSDWRTVKGRKCLQLIFEVPLEQQGQVLEYLGAPVPDDPKWCGIAKLIAEPTQGGSACKQITAAEYAIKMAHTHAGGSEEVLQGIREYCGVKSTTEFRTNPEALSRFHDWEIYYGYVPEPRR